MNWIADEREQHQQGDLSEREHAVAEDLSGQECAHRDRRDEDLDDAGLLLLHHALGDAHPERQADEVEDDGEAEPDPDHRATVGVRRREQIDRRLDGERGDHRVGSRGVGGDRHLGCGTVGRAGSQFDDGLHLIACRPHRAGRPRPPCPAPAASPARRRRELRRLVPDRGDARVPRTLAGGRDAAEHERPDQHREHEPEAEEEGLVVQLRGDLTARDQTDGRPGGRPARWRVRGLAGRSRGTDGFVEVALMRAPPLGRSRTVGFGSGRTRPRRLAASPRRAERVVRRTRPPSARRPRDVDDRGVTVDVEDVHPRLRSYPAGVGADDQPVSVRPPGGAKLLDGAACDDGATGEDHDVVAEPLHEVELVAREEHRHAGAGPSAQHVDHGVDGDGVQARRRARRARAGPAPTPARPRSGHAAGSRETGPSDASFARSVRPTDSRSSSVRASASPRWSPWSSPK